MSQPSNTRELDGSESIRHIWIGNIRQKFTDVRKVSGYDPSQVYEIDSTKPDDGGEDGPLAVLELIVVARLPPGRGTDAAPGTPEWDDSWNC